MSKRNIVIFVNYASEDRDWVESFKRQLIEIFPNVTFAESTSKFWPVDSGPEEKRLLTHDVDVMLVFASETVWSYWADSVYSSRNNLHNKEFYKGYERKCRYGESLARNRRFFLAVILLDESGRRWWQDRKRMELVVHSGNIWCLDMVNWVSGQNHAAFSRLEDLIKGSTPRDNFRIASVTEAESIRQATRVGPPKPPKNIFVSFSKQDRAEALKILTRLEAADLKCWISCRDVPHGHDYQDAIVEALDQAVAMVLVFSKNANNSAEIKKELALASENKLFVLPVRIESAEPTKGLKYQLATRQYIDLFEDREKNMTLIIATLQKQLQS
jgi:TIR domain